MISPVAAAKPLRKAAPLPTINTVVNATIGNWLDIAFQDRAAAVSRTIIYDDDLDVPERCGPDRGHDFGNSIAFVITGDNDGDFHRTPSHRARIPPSGCASGEMMGPTRSTLSCTFTKYLSLFGMSNVPQAVLTHSRFG